MKRLILGVSPIVATLLLILISIASASLIYLFVTGYISTSSVQRQYAQSQIAIEAASIGISGTNVSINAYIRNIGQQDIPRSGWSVYLYDRNGDLVGVLTAFNLTSDLLPGQVQSFNQPISNTTPIIIGQLYDVKVVSPVGTFDVVRVKA